MITLTQRDLIYYILACRLFSVSYSRIPWHLESIRGRRNFTSRSSYNNRHRNCRVAWKIAKYNLVSSNFWSDKQP